MKITKRQLRRIIKEEKQRLLKEQDADAFNAALEELRFVVEEIDAYAGAASRYHQRDDQSDEGGEASRVEQEVYESVHDSLLPVLKMFEKLQSKQSDMPTKASSSWVPPSPTHGME